MASCVIKRDKNRRVSSVTTLSGERSKLFDKIVMIPLMENRERAVSLFKSVYSGKFKKLFGDWIKNTPINKKAYNRIKNKIKYVPEDLRSFVLEKAAMMDNPLMVSKVNPPENIQEDGQSFYSSDLSSGDIYLVNAISESDMDLTSIPEGMSDNEYINGSLSLSTSPVTYITTPGDKSYIVIKDNIKKYSPSELVSESEREVGLTYSTGEPRLFFKTSDNRLFEDYGDALRNTNDTEIQAGFVAGKLDDIQGANGIASSSFNGSYSLNDEKMFIPLIGLDTSTDIKTGQGVINYLIKKGYLSGSKVYDAETNRYYLTGAGETGGMRIFNSVSAYSELMNVFGSGRVSMDERGYITISQGDRSKVPVLDQKGKRSNVSKDEIKEGLKLGRYNELQAKYQHFDALVVSLIFEDGRIFKDYTSSIIQNVREDELRKKNAIANILMSLGIRVVGMSDYLEKYKTKYGHEPSAKALADIANNVIAVAEEATLNDVLEETAHFLVEAYTDQESIRRALEEVESTDEWSEFASEYYNVYGKTLSGSELDEAVRREILGKIIKNRFAESFLPVQQSNETGFIASVKDLIRNMVNSIRSKLSGQRSELNKVIEDINRSFTTEDLSRFDTSMLKSNTYTLYSITKDTNAFLRNKISNLRKTAFRLRQIASDRAVTSNMELNKLADIERKLNQTEAEITDNEIVLSLNSLITSAEAQVNYLDKLMEEVDKDKSGRLISPADRQNIQVITEQVIPMLTDVRGFINKNLNLKGDLSNYTIEGKKLPASEDAIKSDFTRRVDKTISDLNRVKSDIDSHLEQDSENLINTLLTRWHVPAEHVDKVKAMFDKVQNDISVLARWFGILEHSSNIINGSLGMLIAENNYNAMVKTQDDLRGLLADVKKGNWNVSKFENLIQKVNDKYSNYLVSAIDMARFDYDYRFEQMRAFREIAKEAGESMKELAELTDNDIKDIVNSDKPRAFKIKITDMNGKLVEKTINIKPSLDRVNLDFLTAEQELRYSEIMRKWSMENEEQPFINSYEERMANFYEDVKNDQGVEISESTKEYLKYLSRQKYILKAPFYNPDGTFRSSDFATSSNYDDYNRLMKQKKEAASRYMYIGGQRLEKDGKDLELANELSAINKQWQKVFSERKSGNVSKEFMDTLNALQAEDDGSYKAWLFMSQGGHVSFSEKFWKDMGFEQIGSTKSNNIANYQKLADEIDRRSLTNDKDKLNDIVNKINNAKETIREIISNNRDSSNPGDVAFDSMTASEIETVQRMTEEIEYYMSDLLDRAKEQDINIDDYLKPVAESENVVNEVYEKAMKDSGMKDYEFAMKHMTKKKAEKVMLFKRKLTGYGNGSLFKFQEVSFLSKELGIPDYRKANVSSEKKKQLGREFREKVNVAIEQMSPSEREKLVSKYARQFVMPYFKRMTPIGYADFLKKIKDGKINIPQLLSDMNSGKSTQDYGMDIKYLNFDPNSQWTEESAEEDNARNPDYRPNHGYGFHLPKRSKYTDNKYLDYFGIKEVNGVEEATRNIEEWNMLNKLKEISSKSQDLYKLRNKNIYKLPQISKQSIERFARLSERPVGVVENYVKDLVSDRVDDSIYGRTDNTESVDVMDRNKAVPRYYINELENKNDVSHDLAYSYSMLIAQANLYDEKNRTLKDAIGLEQMMLNTQFNNGKKPEATQAYAMFKDFMNDYFYGIRTNTKKVTFDIGGLQVDLTKFMNMVEKFFSTMNLALSPFVAATGMVTGQANFLIEGSVGQYIDWDSTHYAYRELSRVMPSYINEIGDIDRKSKLYVLGERFGVFNYRNRLYGAGYNRVVRTLTRDPFYKMMEIANSPLDPQILIASLDGVRFYDGRFFTKKELTAYIKEKGGNTESAKETWKGLREKSLWNLVDVKDGVLYAKEDSDISTDAILSELAARRNRVRSLMQICNGSLNEENRIAATRNWFLRFATAHRGWLFLTAQRLWKKKGYNFQTMQEEEGLVITIKNLLKSTISMTSEQGIRNIGKAWFEEYPKLSEYEKTNIRRLAVYASVFGIMNVMSLILSGWRDDDDEEDSWITQFTTYIGLRTINEIASQMPVLMEMNVLDIINDPFVMARKMSDLTNLDNYSMDKVTSGAYEGDAKLWRLFSKMTFIKQWYGIKTPESIKMSSDWWIEKNQRSLMFFWGDERNPNKDEDLRD